SRRRRARDLAARRRDRSPRRTARWWRPSAGRPSSRAPPGSGRGTGGRRLAQLLLAQVGRDELGIGQQVPAAPLEDDLALGQYVGPVGVAQGHVDELLDEKDRGAVAVGRLQDLE